MSLRQPTGVSDDLSDGVSDDLAGAALFLMRNFNDPEIINVGTGTDLTIRELAEMVSRITGYEGKILFDTTKPDGTPRKLLDISKLTARGWKATTTLEAGLAQTYEWYSEAVTAA